jgi:RHS repeat-associated protein
LNITDAFNSADTQNCAFTHDDLTRLASANCGAIWSQTFSYDAFGNISKSGTSQFLPIYKDISGNTSNRFVSIPGTTVSYDANGNVLSDGSHTYTWNSDNKPLTVDSIGVTYDALGRPVEQNRSGAYTQFVYSPSGAKLGIMSGQTLQKGLVPLPGGGVAVYNASGLLYYGHSDHLGSIRFGSTTTRTMSFDIAYAPFGEAYATSGTTDPSFTSQRQDTVAGLYDFPERQYSTQGRWPTTDRLGLGSVRLFDPQTLNRYAYVRNNPLSFVDPSGLEESIDCLLDSEDELCGGGGGASGGGGGGGQDPTSGGDQGNSGGNCGANDPACLGNAVPGAADAQDPLNNPLVGPSSQPAPPQLTLTVSLSSNPITGEVSVQPGEIIGGSLTTSEPLSSGTATATVTLFSTATGNPATPGTVGLVVGTGSVNLPMDPGAQQLTGLSVSVPTASNNGSFGFTVNGYLTFTVTDSQGNRFVGSSSVTVGTSGGQPQQYLLGSTTTGGGTNTFKVP